MRTSREGGVGFWHLIAHPAAAPAALPGGAATWAARLAGLTSPAMAADLLGPVADKLLDGEAVRLSRLQGRFRRARQRQTLRWIASAGFDPVALKGFANAALLYGDPDARVVGDLDILVRPEDWRRLVDFLGAAGYRFMPAPLPRWGFISDASLAPCISPDGAVNVDIHLKPDCYPLSRGLSAEAVLGAGCRIEEDAYALPALEHVLLLAISNASKDKFGPFAVKQLADALVLLRDHGGELDWEEILWRVRRARLWRAFRVTLALFLALGLPRECLPRNLHAPVDRVKGGEFERLVAAWSRLFDGATGQPGPFTLLRREWLLSAEPDVAVVRTWWRMKGLARPRTGVPSRH
ncbi:nucleotidyltransferase family protein [Ferruginivarius sediminum]|nr:nucleotidyltransferase family protein [Ferruginivarius sediminum]